MNQLEYLFKYLQESTEIVKEEYNLNYLEAIVKNILLFLDDSNDELLKEYYQKIKEKEYDVKTIRQAILYLTIKGFKEDGLKVNITPDQISYLFVFLINKFFNKEDSIKILDPLVGSGNLLSVIINELESNDYNDLFISGVDNDLNILKLAEASFNMQEKDIELIYQNILTFNPTTKYNLVVSDVPSIYQEGYYFPYQMLISISDYILEEGKLILLVNEDFFDNIGDLRDKLLSIYQVLGLITLPDDLFVNQKKVILILNKSNPEEKKGKAFISEIKSFTDIDSFNQSIKKINEWFREEK